MESGKAWPKAEPTSDWTQWGPMRLGVRHIVAFNLQRARRERGWGQADLCARLRETAGLRWSVATLSAAEAGWGGKSGRVRHFDVAELVAFSLALELPVTWFLLPPSTSPDGSALNDGGERWIDVGLDADQAFSITTQELTHVVTSRAGSEDSAPFMVRRLQEAGVSPEETPPDAAEILRHMDERIDDLKQALIDELRARTESTT